MSYILQYEFQKKNTKGKKQYKLNVIVCDSLLNKMRFFKKCYITSISDKNQYITFDLEFGQNRIGLMQIKFDDDIDVQQEQGSIYLIDPYDFKSDQEKLILSFFIREILCKCCTQKGKAIYKIAHGIYSLDYQNIKSQLLCNLPQQYQEGFMENLLDTRILSQYLLYRNNTISKFSGNDVYTFYITQGIIDQNQYKKMIKEEISLNIQKQKGFSIDINNINEQIVTYSVNDVVFLFDSLFFGELQFEQDDFTSLSQILYIFTKLRKEQVRFSKVNYNADGIKNIFKAFDEEKISFQSKQENKGPNPQQQQLQDIYKNIVQFMKIYNIDQNQKINQIIALGQIEQTKIICEMLVKMNIYMNYIPKDRNQIIYNLRNNFSQYLHENEVKLKEFKQQYEDLQKILQQLNNKIE